ncbi:hypothetical protein QLQ12_40055 [Actinoplanes sp. NEAU-A12]|uniref:Uncharacterized protein n=1 Tax=Actinoplanes sandaracinus TaxID=3045177 RepID=A0ABT6WYI6_9ACTN|nr:hypothetical protein [Actinoplanes sandaracinus]MDI6104802.1 hypothetical protein [Actinoplanes sandaracinus]
MFEINTSDTRTVIAVTGLALLPLVESLTLSEGVVTKGSESELSKTTA